MKIRLKNNLQTLMKNRGCDSWSDLAERLRENQGYSITRTSLSRQSGRDSPAYSMDLIEAICNELQCLPDAIFHIEIDDADPMFIDRMNSRIQPFEFGAVHMKKKAGSESPPELDAAEESGPDEEDPYDDPLIARKVTHLSKNNLKK